MWIQYNENPLHKSVGDCVIRAVSIVMEYSWAKTYVELCIQGLLMCDMPSSDAVWGAYLKEHGFKRYSLPDDCPDCYTIKDFAHDHPSGIYAVGTGSHVCAIVDGCYVDSWDSGNETPIFYWRKEAWHTTTSR